MSENVAPGKFIAYVGEADFHDGFVQGIAREGDKLHVTVKGDSGRYYDVVFSTVVSVLAERVEGMMLYALSEVSCTPPLRKFVFLNWYGPEDTDDPEDPEFDEWKRKLEIVAESFFVLGLNNQNLRTNAH